MNENQVLFGTLLDPSTVNAADHGIETADLSKIGKRAPRPHVLLQQTDLPSGAWSCFYTAAFRCAADAYELTPDEKVRALKAWKAGWDKLIADGKFIPGTGGRMADGVDYARRAWNAEFPEKRVRSYRGEFPDAKTEANTAQLATYRALNNNWMLTFGRYSSDAIMGDLLDDGIIQGDASPSGSGIYGHLSCAVVNPNPDCVTDMDNYPKWERDGVQIDGKPWKNVHVLDDVRLKRTNGQIFPSTYIILPA